MWFQKKSETMPTYARILLKDQLGFQVGKKNGEEWDNQLFDTVSGEFVKIETDSYTSKETGEERELVKVHLWDDKEGMIVVSTAWTGVARNIVNSLAGETKLGMLEMGLYQKQGKDGKFYPSIWMKNNKEQMKWKYSIEEQNKMISEVEFKGKKMRDFAKFEETLKGEFDSINKKSEYTDTPLEKNPDHEVESEDCWVPF